MSEGACFFGVFVSENELVLLFDVSMLHETTSIELKLSELNALLLFALFAIDGSLVDIGTEEEELFVLVSLRFLRGFISVTIASLVSVFAAASAADDDDDCGGSGGGGGGGGLFSVAPTLSG